MLICVIAIDPAAISAAWHSDALRQDPTGLNSNLLPLGGDWRARVASRQRMEELQNRMKGGGGGESAE